MKRFFLYAYLLISFSVIFLSCQPAHQPMIALDLTNGWQFRQLGKAEWLPAKVPGTVHQDLFAAKLIPDYHIRLQEQEVQWVENEDWEYETTFEIDNKTLSRNHVELVFEGLDTYADVYVNDQLIYQAHNMFIAHRVEAKPALVAGANKLRVHFKSAVKEGMKKLQTLPYTLKATNEQAPEAQRTNVFTRKAPFHYGWDWGPRLVTCGIWRPVRLEAWGTARLSDVYFQPQSVTADSAAYLAQVELQADGLLNGLEVRVFLNDSLVGATSLKGESHGQFIADMPVTIKQPKRWWPVGYGDQYRYQTRVELVADGKVVDQKAQPLGVRKVELVQEADSVGHSFLFRVNDVPVFAKGANYIPNETLTPAAQTDTYNMVLDAAIAGNMNMLRVWGGAIYENDEFYELCDQKGILVWQDFMFACALMPPIPEHLEDIRQEANYNVKRLRKFSSVALWCGNNENLIAWNNWGWKTAYEPEISGKLWQTYQEIFLKILPEAVKNHHPEIAYWSSSPSSIGDQMPDRRSGDEHDWTVWFAQKPFSNYRNEVPRFVSEYGIQGYAPLPTIEGFTDPADRDPNSEVMRKRQRSKMEWIRPGYDGNDMIEKYVNDYFRKPTSFPALVYASQLMQALAFESAIEAHRGAKPHCMGSLYWQINDCWPTTSWASMDYFGNWKAAHYAIREAFAPVVALPYTDKGRFTLRIVSDKLVPIEGMANVQVTTFDGTLVTERTTAFRVEANGNALVMDLPEATLLNGRKREELVGHITLISGPNVLAKRPFYFTEPKNLRLQQPVITLSANKVDGGYELTLQANTLAKGVMLECKGIKGHFDRNFIDLLAHDRTTVFFRTTTDLPTPDTAFTVYSLFDSYQQPPM